MKKKLVKYGKILLAITLIGALALPSYATVGAADGSAFVTKAEFDAALSDFNARLTTFEAGINSKIDSQVSSYLDRNGIWNGKSQDCYFCCNSSGARINNVVATTNLLNVLEPDLIEFTKMSNAAGDILPAYASCKWVVVPIFKANKSGLAWCRIRIDYLDYACTGGQQGDGKNGPGTFCLSLCDYAAAKNVKNMMTLKASSINGVTILGSQTSQNADTGGSALWPYERLYYGSYYVMGFVKKDLVYAKCFGFPRTVPTSVRANNWGNGISHYCEAFYAKIGEQVYSTSPASDRDVYHEAVIY